MTPFVPKSANCNSSIFLLTNASTGMPQTTTMPAALTPTGAKLMTDRESPDSHADVASSSSFPATGSRGYPLLKHPLPIFPASISSPAAPTSYPYGSNLFHCFMENATRHRISSGSNAYPSLGPYGSASAFTPLRPAAAAAASGFIWNPAVRTTLPNQSSPSTTATSSSANKETKWNEHLMSQLPIGLGQLIQQQQQHEVRYSGAAYGNSRSWQIASSLILSHLRSLSMNQTMNQT